MAYCPIDIAKYSFCNGDMLLFDANVWLRIHGPNKPGDWKVAVYSSAYAQILLANAKIIVEVLVLSEFVNRYARLRHDLAKADPRVPSDFKAFRNSAHFAPIAQDIAADLKKIVGGCARVDTPLESMDVATLIGEYEKGQSDFNDLVLADLCKARNLKLVTHDSDFKGLDLTVITANKALLT